MLLLPKTVGPFTLVRKLGAGGVAESYMGRLSSQDDKPVVVRRILPYILRDPPRLTSTEARVRDLMGIHHPFVVPVLDWVEDGGERFIVEEYVEGVDLDRVLAGCRTRGRTIPHNVFLNLATQICNGLEALHGRPGKGTGTDNVLHLALKPSAILLTSEGKVIIGSCGLARSPTSLPHGGVAGPVPTRMEYLSPEQTHSDQKLIPASDIFSLGAVLYELLTLQPLFRSDSNLQTIHKIRRAEITTQLLRVKEIMPGLDKVLYRALSLNPRHRYQRAFVLREDLRGLMANYSFSSIVEDTRAFIAPLLQGSLSAEDGALVHPAADDLTDAATAEAQTAEAQSVEPQIAASPELEPAAVHPAVSPEPSPAEPVTAELSAAADFPSAQGRLTTPFEEEPERPTAVGGPAQPIPDLPPFAPPGFDGTADHTVGIEPTEGFDLGDDGAPPAPQMPEASPAAPPDLVIDEPLAPPSPVPVPDSTHGYAPSPDEAPEPAPVRVLPPSVVSAHLDEPPTPAADTTEQPEALPSAVSLTPISAATLQSQADPNSTRGFLRGDAPVDAATDAAPPTEPADAPESEVFMWWVPPPAGHAAAAPTPSQTASPTLLPEDERAPAPVAPVNLASPATAAAPPTTPPEPAAPQPAAPQPAAPQPAAPQPAAPQPAAGEISPTADALYTTAEDDDEEEWQKRPRYGMWATGLVVAALLVIVCAGGLTWFGFDAVGDLFDGGDMASAADPEPAPQADAGSALAQPEDGQVNEARAIDDPGADDDAIADLVADEPADPPTPGPAVAPARSSAAPTAQDSASRSSAPRTSAPRTSAPRADSYSFSGSSYDPGEAAIVDASLDQPEDAEEPGYTNLDGYAAKAEAGRLTSSDVLSLEMVDVDDRAYSRSRALLLMQAKKNGDSGAIKRALDDLMVLPENRYNPVFLTDLGGYYVNKRQYSKALNKAVLAERYWARLPPELVFVKKAEIYEIQAASYQGMFYQSEDDMELLDQAIRHWEKYRTHVTRRSRSDMARRADEQLAKLEDIRTRLQ